MIVKQDGSFLDEIHRMTEYRIFGHDIGSSVSYVVIVIYVDRTGDNFFQDHDLTRYLQQCHCCRQLANGGFSSRALPEVHLLLYFPVKVLSLL